MDPGNEEAVITPVGAGQGLSISPAMAVKDETRPSNPRRAHLL
jgi:hypothetical protein